MPAPVTSPLPLRKRLLFSFISLILFFLLLEGLLSLVWTVWEYLRFRASLPVTVQFKEEFHTEYDPQLGWVNIAGKRLVDFYGPRRSLTINNDGLRGLEDVGSEDTERFRVVCLGDSFTLGYGVDDRHTYPAQLAKINPAVEALNMGQGGYSVGQCFLWFERDGGRLAPDCVVFALIVDDIWRLNEGRLLNGAAAPEFELRDGKLVTTGQPVPAKIEAGKRITPAGLTVRVLSNQSALIRTLTMFTQPVSQQARDQREQKMAITLAICAELHRRLSTSRTPLVIMLMPEIRELSDGSLSGMYHEISHTVGDFAEDRGILFLDLYDSFAREQSAQYYLEEHWHHYSEAGNLLVAQQLDAFLAQTVPTYPAGRDAPAERRSEPAATGL